jgi:uncharacterized protein (TIGR02444 family)
MSTDDTSSPAPDSPFWRFSLRFYRQPAVADACIRLQEEAGVDVNLLLFLLWHATQKRALLPAEVIELERRIAGWREMTVVPLRAVRRALKSPPALVAPTVAEFFRTRIKAAELEAERLQQAAMYEFARSSLLGRDASSLVEAARANVAAYETMRGVAFPAIATETLLAALLGLERKPED